MTKNQKTFVLVGDDQVPASPRDVLSAVQSDGFKAAGAKFGFSESTLRKFLAENHYVAVRQVTYQKTPEPLDGRPEPDTNKIERARTTTSDEAQVGGA